MPARRTVHTNRSTQETDPLPAETAPMETEPMRCWPHPIVAVPAGGTCPTARSCEDLSQVLERLDCQNQLLCDLLGAVNSLTAALLCREGKH